MDKRIIPNLLLQILVVLLLVLTFSFNSTAFAHPGRTASDGCHYCRTNCGSWGVPWYERHCHGGTYPPPLPPTPTPTPIELNLSATYRFDENVCRYEIITSWDDPVLYDRYSISAVKSESSTCLDPGPNPDTTRTNWTFVDRTSGNYVINIKPGNQYGWNWYSYCTNLSIPKIKPSLQLKETLEGNEKYIEYLSKCTETLVGDNGIGSMTLSKGTIKISPQKETTYQFTATSRDGEIETKSLTISPITPTATPAAEKQANPTPLPEKINGSTNFLMRFLRWLF